MVDGLDFLLKSFLCRLLQEQNRLAKSPFMMLWLCFLSAVVSLPAWAQDADAPSKLDALKQCNQELQEEMVLAASEAALKEGCQKSLDACDKNYGAELAACKAQLPNPAAAPANAVSELQGRLEELEKVIGAAESHVR